MQTLRSKACAVLILVACATAACSDARPRADAGPSPSSPTVDDEYLDDLCSRQVRAFGWVLPLRADYKGFKPKLKRAAETVRQELDDLEARGYGDDSAIASYLEELLELAKVLGDRVRDRDIADLQLRYSLVLQTMASVYERAVDAGLPIDCRFDFESEGVELLFFQSDAAEICRLAHQQIVNAVQARTAGNAQSPAFLGDVGSAYLQLSEALKHADPEKLELELRNQGRQLVTSYRGAGKALLASQRALRAGDETARAAAIKRFDRYTEEAKKVARSMDLIFCENLLPFD